MSLGPLLSLKAASLRCLPALLPLVLVLLSACSPRVPETETQNQIADGEAQVRIQNGIASFLESVGFSPREEVFQVQCQVDSGRAVFTGEVSDRARKAAMFEAVLNLVPGIKLVDSITVLPTVSLEGRDWAVVCVPVLDLGDAPNSVGGKNTVTQARMGDILRILKEDEGWYLCQMDDRYLGWVSSAGVWVTGDDPTQSFFSGEVALVTSKMTAAYRDTGEVQAFTQNLVQGTVLPLVSTDNDWASLALPGGGVVKARLRDLNRFQSYSEVFSEKKGVQGVLETAREYLGLPYLWGGCTAYGFDCSGFTQFCLKHNGYRIRRDADMQYEEGEIVEDRANLLPGDLVFFQTYREGASHVGFYLGDSRYVHSGSNGVAVNSFDPSHDDYSANLDKKYLGARRIIK